MNVQTAKHDAEFTAKEQAQNLQDFQHKIIQMETANFQRFIPAMARRGINKVQAYQMMHDGLVETFLIGRMRFVVNESLRTLPERMKAQAQGGAE